MTTHTKPQFEAFGCWTSVTRADMRTEPMYAVMARDDCEKPHTVTIYITALDMQYNINNSRFDSIYNRIYNEFVEAHRR